MAVPNLKDQANLRQALLHFNRGEMAAALPLLRALLKKFPKDARLLTHAGVALRETGDPDRAAPLLRRSVEFAPGYSDGWLALGNYERDRGQWAEAEAAYRRAMTADPGNTPATLNLASLMGVLGRWEEGHRLWQAILAQTPNDRKILGNYAFFAVAAGHVDEAVAALDRARPAADDEGAGFFRKGAILLSLGRFAEAWPDYRGRWQGRDREIGPPKDFGLPEWRRAQSAPGDRIWVWREQGIGDELVCASQLGQAVDQGFRIRLGCDPRFLTLFRRSFPQIEVVPVEEGPGDCRWQVALGDFLAQYISDFGDIRGRAFLKPDPARVADLRQRYRAEGGGKPVIGIAWRSKSQVFGAMKSMRLRDWADIIGQPGFSFLNLQYGDTAAERAEVEKGLGVRLLHDATIDPMGDLDPVAAQVAACDMVITVSNVTAHFAGALGLPGIVLLPQSEGLIWHWFRDRETSPWYPSLQLLRQQRGTDWQQPLAETARRLRNMPIRGI